MRAFEIAAGSVPGTDHTNPGRPGWKNNQDAADFFVGPDHLIGVVCDGCGGPPNSRNELGAQLGARLVISRARELLQEGKHFGENPDVFLELLAGRICDDLQLIAEIAIPERRARSAYVDQHLLFTIMGVIIDKNTTLVFSFGDGVYAVNGEVQVIPPFDDNKPSYIAYRFVPSTCDPDTLRFQVRAALPTAEVSSILIGSDGVADLINAAERSVPVINTIGPLSQFWEDPSFTLNPDKIRRRLALINCERVGERNLIHGGPLRDDTTLLVVRPA